MTEGKREERIEERPYPTHHLPPYVALLLYPLLTLAPYCHSRWSLLTVTSDERSEETSDGGATGLVNEENLSHQSLHLLITLLIHLIRRSRPLRGVNEMESEE